MTRRMSCSLTIEAVRLRIKTVTRRDPLTWTTLEPGDHLLLVEKAMGLPKGARQVVLAEVVVTYNDVEPLSEITRADVRREGFAEMTVDEFIRFWLRSHGLDPDNSITALTHVRRIAWRYLP